MKRFTLILSLLVAMVTTTMAQEPVEVTGTEAEIAQWRSDGTTFTPWSGPVGDEKPDGVVPSDGNVVYTADSQIEISTLGRLYVTFDYTSGAHRLNILGIAVLDENDEIVAYDYHNGATGGSDTNNVYTVVLPLGTYTIRYFVEHKESSNDLRKTNGQIWAQFVDSETAKNNGLDEIYALGETNMFDSKDVQAAKDRINAFVVENADQYISFEGDVIQTKYDLIKTIDGNCYTFNSKGRQTTDGRYLSVKDAPNYNGVMTVVATDMSELNSMWKLIYAGQDCFYLLNLKYDVYPKTTSEATLSGNTALNTTSSSEEAGEFFIAPQTGGLVAIGSGSGSYSYMHEADWNGHEIVRWEASADASQWTAVRIEEPELCTITYEYIFNEEVFRTEHVNVVKGNVYTFAREYSKAGLNPVGDIPEPEEINEDKVITYEYEANLPFESAAISNNRLVQSSKLYKITLREKSVQLNADGTDFEYNNNSAAIENQLFAFVGSAMQDWQIFNYAAGLDKPIWSVNNNDNTDFLPTAGVTDKFELAVHNANWSFKKKGTNAYLHDYGGNFAVWNSATGNQDPGSYVVFTEATDKEISVATINLDMKDAEVYLENELLDQEIKMNLQTVIGEANKAIVDEDCTVETLNEIDARLYALIQDAANDLVVINANGFKNNAVYSFTTTRGTLLYNENNPNVVASSKAYSNIEIGGDKAHCQWAVYKSSRTGNYYMYNIGAEKFMGDSDGQIPFVEKPTNSVSFYAGTYSGHPIIVSTNNSSAVNHYNHGAEPGVANWGDGLNNLGDAGSCHQVNKVAFIDDETLSSIINLVDNYELGLELQSYLDDIYEDYYDAWANGGSGAWRIAEGINNYSQPEGDYDLVTAYNEAREYLDGDVTEEGVQAHKNKMAELVANLQINQPETGKYYRLRCVNGKKYMSSNTNENGKILMNSNGSDTTGILIFYYDGYTQGENPCEAFMTYTTGRYVSAAQSQKGFLLGVGEKKDFALYDGKDNQNPGSYLVQVNSSYLFGKNDVIDRGGSKPTGGDTGYNWWLEEVKELPVTITAAGYSTLYAPVALQVPEGVKAYTVTINGEWATLNEIEGGVIPANTGVVIGGANGEKAVPETYNFTITTADAFNGTNALEGTVAATYVAKDAYVLSYIDTNEDDVKDEVGFYIATKNQAGNTAFQNNSHKAYLPMPAGAEGIKSYSFRFGEGTTGVDEITDNRVQSTGIYDLTGRRVENPSNGIYIINGVKVLVK